MNMYTHAGMDKDRVLADLAWGVGSSRDTLMDPEATAVDVARAMNLVVNGMDWVVQESPDLWLTVVQQHPHVEGMNPSFDEHRLSSQGDALTAVSRYGSNEPPPGSDRRESGRFGLRVYGQSCDERYLARGYGETTSEGLPMLAYSNGMSMHGQVDLETVDIDGAFMQSLKHVSSYVNSLATVLLPARHKE